MPDNVIGTFCWFVSDLVGRVSNKIRQKQIISKGYKYWWYLLNLNITNVNIDHLLDCIVMTSTQLSPRTVSEKLNKDNKNMRFLKEVLDWVSVNTTPKD